VGFYCLFTETTRQEKQRDWSRALNPLFETYGGQAGNTRVVRERDLVGLWHSGEWLPHQWHSLAELQLIFALWECGPELPHTLFFKQRLKSRLVKKEVSLLFNVIKQFIKQNLLYGPNKTYQPSLAHKSPVCKVWIKNGEAELGDKQEVNRNK
jgi:hypothetical protein